MLGCWNLVGELRDRMNLGTGAGDIWSPHAESGFCVGYDIFFLLIYIIIFESYAKSFQTFSQAGRSGPLKSAKSLRGADSVREPHISHTLIWFGPCFIC